MANSSSVSTNINNIWSTPAPAYLARGNIIGKGKGTGKGEGKILFRNREQVYISFLIHHKK